MATIRNLIVRISVTENTDKGIRRVTTSLRETNREIDQADKGSNRFTGTLSRLGRFTLGSLVGGLTNVAKFTWLAGKGLFFVAAGAASLNTVMQAGSALAPLAGGLLLIPGAAVAAATALGTLHLAMSGVGDAFKQALSSKQDPKKFAASLKDLSPAARSVAIELHRMRPELIGIRNAAQQALFAPLTGQLTAMARVLAGPVRTGVAQVAGQFGLAGRSVAEFARQSASVELVRAAFGQTSVAIHNLLPALQPVLAGFRSLAEEGLSFLPLIANSAGQLATRFGLWLQQIVKTGQAADWIRNALATLRQIGTVLGNLGGILKSVFSAASAGGSQFLGVIGAALGQLNAFLKTAQGKAALASVFQGLAAIGRSLGPVIGALVTQLGTLARPVGQLATMIGPILTVAINALGPAIAALAPGVQALLGGLGGAVKALAPALVPLGQALAQIGVALGPVLPIVGRLIAQLVSGLAPVLGQLLIALSPLAVAVVRLVGAFTPLIPPLAKIIVQLVQGLVPALTPIIGIISQVAGVIGTFLVTAIGMIVQAIIPLLPQLSQMAQTIGQQLMVVLIALAPALLQVLQAILPLLPSLISMTPVWVRLVVAVTPLATLLIRLAAAILRVLLPPVVSIVGWLMRFNATVYGSTLGAVVQVISAIGRMPGQIIGLFSKAGSWLVNVGKNIVIGLWNGIVSLGSWLYNKLVGFAKALIPAPIKWALGIASPSKVMAELGKFAGMGLAVGLDASRTGVSAAATRLAGAAIPAMGAFAAPAGVVAAAGAPTAGGRGGGGVDAKTLAAAVKDALHGVTVHMDSQPVGQIVSRQLGRATDQRRRTG